MHKNAVLNLSACHPSAVSLRHKNRYINPLILIYLILNDIVHKITFISTDMAIFKESSNPVVVLVPGAWHTGQAYDLLTSPIREKGYEPFPIQLPSVGISPGLPDFSADVAAIRAHVTKIMDQENRDVVLVMHSYGGVPGTEAMKGLSKKERKAAGKGTGVVALVYIASLVPGKGFNCSDPLGGETEEEKARQNIIKLKDNGVSL